MANPQIKVKLQRRPQLKLKVLPRFPANVSAASPILLSNVGGNYSFSFDASALAASYAGTFQAHDVTLDTLSGKSTTGTGSIVLSSSPTFSGAVLVGGVNGTAPITGFATGILQLHGVGGAIASSLYRWQAANLPPRITFSKSRGATQNDFTIVNSGDSIGIFHFAGSDGTVFQEAANIQAMIDGAPGAGSMPGKIGFFTSASGSGTPVQRASIFSDGGVVIGSSTSSPGAGILSVAKQIQFGSFTVATLPAGSAGQTVFCSNCRMFNGAGVQEGAGSGTGGLVSHNGTAWKIAGTNVTAVA